MLTYIKYTSTQSSIQSVMLVFEQDHPQNQNGKQPDLSQQQILHVYAWFSNARSEKSTGCKDAEN